VPVELPTVFAARDITFGTVITQEMVDAGAFETRVMKVEERSGTAFNSDSLLIGKTARQDIGPGKQLTADDFSVPGGGSSLTRDDIDIPPGQVAMAVQVDQVSGVGTVIRAGDYVDLLIGLQGGSFPVVTASPESGEFTVVSGLNATSTKLLLQGMQVLGTLLPPPVTAEGAPPAEGEQSTGLTGQQEIVILSVTPQQAEVIKFAQLDASISLVLRAPEDFRDANGDPIVPTLAGTTGITLRVLVDEYDVLIPQLVETVLPAQETP
jgi:Flp pilus assembly protein CpaB